MADFTQANRPIRVDTGLGEDVLLLSGFNGLEAISQPFSFQLELLSIRSDIDPSAILRTGAVLTVKLPDGAKRHVHGLVSRFAQLGARDELVVYRAEIVPWLWFLTLSRESRIYQDLAVPDILEQVFKRLGYSDFEFRLTRPYGPRTYCVQYRETHLDFVSRLMEEEGIYYYFEHSENAHVLVVCDDNVASKPGAGAGTIRFSADERHDDNVVWQLEREHSVHAGRITLWDYDYLKPSVRLASSLGEESEEVYDYPGGYHQLDDGDRLARLLLEQAESGRQHVQGLSNCPGLVPGNHFTLEEHYRRDANGRYLITQVQHLASAGGAFRAWDDSAALDYRAEFVAIPHETPYRPIRQTPRPSIPGSQTALVVGPQGEEVFVDKYGRVKVQFHWDRDGQRNENSSCWVRVVTPWGGKGYGSVSVPRIGDEVLIGFEEGDPDRPIIIGSVYNGNQTPPFELPGAGIQMGMKSRSSPGGGGYNEITMTDTKGNELINVHAQYDMMTVIEHDETVEVKNNRSATVGVDEQLTVGNDQSCSIGNDQSCSIGNDQAVVIGSDCTRQIGSNESTTIGSDRNTAIGSSDTLNVGMNRTQTVTVNEAITVGAAQEVTVGGVRAVAVGMNQTTRVGGSMSVGVGADRSSNVGKNDSLTVGKKLVINAGEEIVIQTGKASIVMKKDGNITISGKDIVMKGSGKMDMKMSKDIKLKGKKILHN